MATHERSKWVKLPAQSSHPQQRPSLPANDPQKESSAAIELAPLGDDFEGMSSAGEWVFSDEQLRNTPSQRLGLSQVRPFHRSFRICFHLMAPAPPFPYPLQENEDSMRRSGVALIADLVRLLEVYAMRRPPRALSPPSLSLSLS